MTPGEEDLQMQHFRLRLRLYRAVIRMYLGPVDIERKVSTIAAIAARLVKAERELIQLEAAGSAAK